MFAQPPSPETKTMSVSDVPCVAGTSISGSLVVVARAKRSESIRAGRRTTKTAAVIPSVARDRCGLGGALQSRASHPHRFLTSFRHHPPHATGNQRGEVGENARQHEAAG